MSQDFFIVVVVEKHIIYIIINLEAQLLSRKVARKCRSATLKFSNSLPSVCVRERDGYLWYNIHNTTREREELLTLLTSSFHPLARRRVIVIYSTYTRVYICRDVCFANCATSSPVRITQENTHFQKNILMLFFFCSRKNVRKFHNLNIT